MRNGAFQPAGGQEGLRSGSGVPAPRSDREQTDHACDLNGRSSGADTELAIDRDGLGLDRVA